MDIACAVLDALGIAKAALVGYASWRFRAVTVGFRLGGFRVLRLGLGTSRGRLMSVFLLTRF